MSSIVESYHLIGRFEELLLEIKKCSSQECYSSTITHLQELYLQMNEPQRQAADELLSKAKVGLPA